MVDINVNGMIGEAIPDLNESGQVKTYAFPDATRFELIGENGNPRAFTLAPGAILQIQDEGRTVKIFTNPQVDSAEWFAGKHDWSKNQRSSTAHTD